MGWYILAGLTGLFAGVVFGWALCAIFTVAKCDDCRTTRIDLGSGNKIQGGAG